MPINRTPNTRIPYLKTGSVDQKESFRATGRGLMVSAPSLRANERTGNAVMSYKSISPDGEVSLEKHYLFVTKVSTGWTVSGSYGQANQSRSFYPRNLSQGDFVVEGFCASQRAYDELVAFVQRHHLRIVGAADEIVEGANQTNALTFTMGKPDWSHRTEGWHRHTYAHAPKISWQVAVLNIAAGHERFKFSPPFALVLKVLDDNLGVNEDVEYNIMRNLDFHRTYVEPQGNPVFGTLYNPPAAGPDYTNILVASTQEETRFTGIGTAAGKPGSDGGGDAPGDPGYPVSSNAQYISYAVAAAPGLSKPEYGNKIKLKYDPNCIPQTPGLQYFGQWQRLRGDGTVDPNDIWVKYRDPGGGGGNTIKVGP